MRQGPGRLCSCRGHRRHRRRARPAGRLPTPTGGSRRASEVTQGEVMARVMGGIVSLEYQSFRVSAESLCAETPE